MGNEGGQILEIYLKWQIDINKWRLGKEFSVTDMDETTAVQLVRDTLATLKWEIWETLPKEKRKDIPIDYYEKFLNDRISECAGFTVELVQGRMYKDKKDREIEQIKKDLSKI